MFALLDENLTVARVCMDDQVEWGGAYHSCLHRMSPDVLKKFRIYRLVEADGTCPAYGIESGASFSVDHESGYVTRTRLWEVPPLDSIKTRQVEKLKADAFQALKETDWRMLRALERAMLTVLPAEDQALAEEREALRTASNEAEAGILLATTAAEVKASAEVDLVQAAGLVAVLEK